MLCIIELYVNKSFCSFSFLVGIDDDVQILCVSLIRPIFLLHNIVATQFIIYCIFHNCICSIYFVLFLVDFLVDCLAVLFALLFAVFLAVFFDLEEDDDDDDDEDEDDDDEDDDESLVG